VEAWALVVEYSVDTDVVLEPAAFFRPACDGDYLGTLELADLAGDGTDVPRRS
jgi:hypothetical protein